MIKNFRCETCGKRRKIKHENKARLGVTECKPYPKHPENRGLRALAKGIWKTRVFFNLAP